MSNVVKLSDKKKPDISKWQDELEEHGDTLTARLCDQLRLCESDCVDDGIPDEATDCLILGVLATLLVTVAAKRDILGPGALLKLVKSVVAERQRERRDDA